MGFVEKMIVGKVLAALIASHGSVVVDSERGYDPEAPRFTDAAEALKEADKFDECHFFVGGSYEESYDSWVYVIYGNGNGGWDVISDYTTDLEPILKPINDWIDKEGD